MEIKLNFDPTDLVPACALKPGTEFYAISKLWHNSKTRAALNFYLLWQADQAVSNTLARLCCRLDKQLAKLPNYDIDTFIACIRDSEPTMYDYVSDIPKLAKFVAQHWDYFSPNIRRKLEVTYTSSETGMECVWEY